MCCLRESECIEEPDSVTGVLQVLEPDAGKLARPVLRGGSHGNVTFLPDTLIESYRYTAFIEETHLDSPIFLQTQ